MSDPLPDIPEDENRDAMAPPKEPCECWCMHCGRTFMSDQMWFQKMIGDPSGFDGFWMCPTSNCGGAGFTFDIFPTDPDHPANEGWHYSDDEDSEESDEDAEWDPSESKYTEMDQDLPYDDDTEGEEWKQGATSTDAAESPDQSEARREWEEQQRMYDQPDQRPREVYWVDRRRDDTTPLGEDDIPF